MSPSELSAQTVEAAAAALSGASGFWFTRRCLLFELVRRGAWPDPGDDLPACEASFAVALAEYEAAQAGQLARLVRPEQAIPGLEGPADLERYDLPADLFDYSIQRVALFERIDLCLMLVANGFHREIEIALTVPPRPSESTPPGREFPSHVWARIREQIDAGLPTTFIAIHDCGQPTEPWLAQIDERFGVGQVRRAGLTVPWAARLHLPLRAGVAGSYAVLEELTPLMAMRWIYRRVARGAEDTGFG